MKRFITVLLWGVLARSFRTLCSIGYFKLQARNISHPARGVTSLAHLIDMFSLMHPVTHPLEPSRTNDRNSIR
jgi:hypothetical protein